MSSSVENNNKTEVTLRQQRQIEACILARRQGRQLMARNILKNT